MNSKVRDIGTYRAQKYPGRVEAPETEAPDTNPVGDTIQAIAAYAEKLSALSQTPNPLLEQIAGVTQDYRNGELDESETHSTLIELVTSSPAMHHSLRIGKAAIFGLPQESSPPDPYGYLKTDD